MAGYLFMPMGCQMSAIAVDGHHIQIDEVMDHAAVDGGHQTVPFRSRNGARTDRVFLVDSMRGLSRHLGSIAP